MTNATSIFDYFLFFFIWFVFFNIGIINIAEEIDVIKCCIEDGNWFENNKGRKYAKLYEAFSKKQLKSLLVSLQQEKVLLMSAVNGK